MGESRRRKTQRGSTAPDYILKYTEKGLIASMEETVATVKSLASTREPGEAGEPQAFGLFEKGYPYHEILELSMWMDTQDVSIKVLVKQSETGKFVTLNHDVVL